MEECQSPTSPRVRVHARDLIKKRATDMSRNEILNVTSSDLQAVMVEHRDDLDTESKITQSVV